MDAMSLLGLCGTHPGGRAVVQEALARGDEVTTLTRGESGEPAAGAESRHADRTDPQQLSSALGDDTWDAVIDTWSQAPRVVRDSAELLASRVGHYGYVSSRSVYSWPVAGHADESAPVVEADADSDDGSDYAAAKRGGELATLRYFDGRSVLARAGLILGPYEGVGRMPWCVRRIERGGDVLAPGPKDLPLQYIDCRDLAIWMLHAADEGISGPFNTVSQPGHTTMEGLLNACISAPGSDANLIWAQPEAILAAEIGQWVELPIWVSATGEAMAMHNGDVSAAYAAGLVCLPVQETITDTWHWLQTEGDPPVKEGRPGHGIDPEKERAFLASLG